PAGAVFDDATIVARARRLAFRLRHRRDRGPVVPDRGFAEPVLVPPARTGPAGGHLAAPAHDCDPRRFRGALHHRARLLLLSVAVGCRRATIAAAGRLYRRSLDGH